MSYTPVDVSVYTGRWRDYDKGKILGDRVTLSSSHALILIAFISLFDALVGNIVWSLVSFIIFKSRATDRPRDTLHHQHQALLRNATDPISFARQSANVGWKWSGKARNARARSWGLSLLAISISLLFSAGGILSSQIASTGNVLLHTNGCGSIQPPANESATQQGWLIDQAQNIWAEQITQQSLAYAQNCYNNILLTNSSDAARAVGPLASCDFYVKPTLNWTYTIGNHCPFGDTCSVPDSAVIKMDTGLLSSHDDLGINQPRENQVLWRRIETCSPLTTTGFSDNRFHNISGQGVVAEYAYGTYLGQPYSPSSNVTNTTQPTNATFLYSEAAYVAAGVPYGLQLASVVDVPPNNPIFAPDPRIMENPDSPVTLVFLPTRVVFQEQPVLDPWFEATTLWEVADVPIKYYASTDPGRVLGCLEQAQICNPNKADACTTDLDAWWIWMWNYADGANPEQLQKVFGEIGLNDMQFQTAFNILTYLQDASVASLVEDLGQTMLQAYSLLGGAEQDVSQPLPPNQWQIEANNWFAISLANIQQQALAAVTGPTDPLLLNYLTPYAANDTIDNALCASQKIRSTAYQSFSVLGLALNFVLGGLILLTTVVVRHLLPRMQALKGSSHSHRLWKATGALQLQRMAYEKLELGEWEGEGTVPLTNDGTKFSAPTVPRKADRHRPDARHEKFHGGLRGGDADGEVEQEILSTPRSACDFQDTSDLQDTSDVYHL